MNKNFLSATIKAEARQLGFTACRIVPAGEASHADFFDSWVAAGRAGEMTYLERNRDKRRFPAALVAAADPTPQSLIVLATRYHPYDLPAAIRSDPARGLIASYAWGDDYHDLLRGRLFLLDESIRHHSQRTTLAKATVDSAPVLERNWAQEAGIGFIGKNCCTIRPGAGSWLLLATLLVPEALDYDPPAQHNLRAPLESVLNGLPADGVYGKWSVTAESPTDPPDELRLVGGCGRCTRCIDACPTDAFVGPFHLNPQRCISYWTIEAQAPIPRELRRAFANRIFGCDICQEVCPWNHRLDATEIVDPHFNAALERAAPPLLAGFDPAHPYWLDDAAFAQHFRHSPIKRAKRVGMLRNVCVALGNWQSAEAAPALQRVLQEQSPLVRAHAVWAAGEILRAGNHDALYQSLLALQVVEQDLFVREEIGFALGSESAK